MQGDLKALYKSLELSQANVWVSTPSFADMCLADPIFSEVILPKLSDFLFCGEILTNKTVQRLQQRFPKANIVNTYGPTESTCAITEIVITQGINESISPLPVGRPKTGTWIRIMGEDGEELSDGEIGEIIIVGDSVSSGYWNNDELNLKKFGLTEIDGKTYRFYRTGDAGYMKQGVLYYGGRMDNQVKLHGYRIELEDIESNLLKIPGIIQAVVIPRYRDGKVSSLSAGIVTEAIYNDEKSEIQNIRKLLRRDLPEYMIPKKISFLSDIPRTNNGKMDRKAMEALL